MNNADIGLFRFDFDNTWMAFVMTPDRQIVTRYGGRDDRDPEGRVSLNGLIHTLESALKHLPEPRKGDTPDHKALRPRDLFATKGKGCMHCHHVWEGLRREARKVDRLTPQLNDPYPLPENLGLTLDVTQGEKVLKVKPGSAADRAGVKPDDRLLRAGELAVYSQFDLRAALHDLPEKARLPLVLDRAGREEKVELDLAGGWRTWDQRWRVSRSREKRELEREKKKK
jgi:hypothetical protein